MHKNQIQTNSVTLENQTRTAFPLFKYGYLFSLRWATGQEKLSQVRGANCVWNKLLAISYYIYVKYFNAVD